MTHVAFIKTSKMKIKSKHLKISQDVKYVTSKTLYCIITTTFYCLSPFSSANLVALLAASRL